VLRPALPVLALVALLAAGCGAERATLPSFGPPKDPRFERVRYRSAGLSMELPVGMIKQQRRLPDVFRATRADWYIAAFAYRRKEQLPRNRAELQTARRRLVRQVRKRDQRFRLHSSRIMRVGGARAIELVGDQRISGALLRTRSLHVFRRSAEYVVEMSAPAREFGELDKALFGRVSASVRVTGRVRRTRR
jgi:hypothetical protein